MYIFVSACVYKFPCTNISRFSHKIYLTNRYISVYRYIESPLYFLQQHGACHVYVPMYIHQLIMQNHHVRYLACIGPSRSEIPNFFMLYHTTK